MKIAQIQNKNGGLNKPPISESGINARVNNAIMSSTNSTNEEVNTFIKYSVPRYYKSPTVFCDENKECPMSKKEICQAITENFIVRNNIIAAILNTLPKKSVVKEEDGSENIVYDGGLCYQKFKNLFLCKVCVPLNYRDLQNKDTKDILKFILQKSEFLTNKECDDNKGYFLKLDLQKKAALIRKTKEIKSETDLLLNPQIKFNLFYLECTDKLKNSYFNNLDALLQILIKMQNIPIINNATLNLLGEETKNIINNMYNLCNFYYVFAIIALINADTSTDLPEEKISLEDDFSTILGKNKVNTAKEISPNAKSNKPVNKNNGSSVKSNNRENKK